MANRAERRREARENQKKIAASYVQKAQTEQTVRQIESTINRLQQNGITIADLKKNYDIGYQAGYKAGYKVGHRNTVKFMFAGMILALNDLYRFGQKRNYNVMNKAYEYAIFTLTTEEAIDAVFDRVGLRLNFDDPFDIAEMKKPKKGGKRNG